MNPHLATRKVRFSFNLFAVAFTIGYFISTINYSSADLSKGTIKACIHEVGQSSYSGLESSKNNFSKITSQSVCLINFNSDFIKANLSNYRNFLISLFERNVFYVYTTIHAP
jgi:hypothetical protein